MVRWGKGRKDRVRIGQEDEKVKSSDGGRQISRIASRALCFRSIPHSPSTFSLEARSVDGTQLKLNFSLIPQVLRAT